VYKRQGISEAIRNSRSGFNERERRIAES